MRFEVPRRVMFIGKMADPYAQWDQNFRVSEELRRVPLGGWNNFRSKLVEQERLSLPLHNGEFRRCTAAALDAISVELWLAWTRRRCRTTRGD